MAGSAAAFVPPSADLDDLRAAAVGCTGCDLYREAAQTVFGTGSRSAPLLLVGEQPGDVEDRRGQPFVGPAGAVLWACIEEAGIERSDLFVTNAVKHFKHEVRGKRRIHQKPGTAEIQACHPWLAAEVAAVRPRVVVALGATAARAVMGRNVAIAANRGTVLQAWGAQVLVTYHPSAILRASDRAPEVRAALVADLCAAQASIAR